MKPLVAAALVLAMFGAGCSTDAGSDSSTGQSPSTSQSTHTSPVGLIEVPNFVSDHVMEARTAALLVGLRPVVTRGGQSACLSARDVVQQRPAAGRKVAIGTRVLLVINTRLGECGLNLPPASEGLRRIADRFVEFARTPALDQFVLPVDTPVELFIGGVLEKVIPSGRINDPRVWRTCPGGIGYAARSCPISPLTPFMSYPGPIAATSQPPAHICVPAEELPDRLDVYQSVTLTPDEERDCTSYFAVQLFVNDVGQIVAVNLVLSEP